MARWGKADFRQLAQLAERLEKLSNTDFDAFCRDAANEIAARLLARVVKRTPVGKAPRFEEPRTIRVKGAMGKSKTFLSRSGAIYQRYWAGYQGGNLRDGWTILPIEKKGDQYLVTIANNTEYASYVEYGHRQTPGRYVPALGKRLKAGWVKGRFMLTISVQELEQQAPKLLEERLYAFLQEVF